MPLIMNFSKNLREQHLYEFGLKTYLKGCYICQEGQFSDKMFWILEGECKMEISHINIQRELSILGNGYCFGDESVLFEEKNPYSIIAMNEVELVYCTKESLNSLPLPIIK